MQFDPALRKKAETTKNYFVSGNTNKKVIGLNILTLFSQLAAKHQLANSTQTIVWVEICPVYMQ